MPAAIKCQNCGVEFDVRPSEAGWRKFCCRECKTSFNSVELSCLVCGKAYRKLKSQITDLGSKYCSKPCKDIGGSLPKKPKRVRDPVFKSCKVCGKEFRIPPVRIATATYCSVACKSSDKELIESMSKKQAGENSWRWAGGKYTSSRGYVKRTVTGGKVFLFEHRAVMREWLIEVDPSHPFLVGEDKLLHPDIEVHHIDRVRANNVRSNLLAVTKDAHAKIHHYGRRPEAWECWPPRPLKW
jgi:hypothetical protein